MWLFLIPLAVCVGYVIHRGLRLWRAIPSSNRDFFFLE